MVGEGLQFGEGLVADAAVVRPVAFPQPPPQSVVGRADEGSTANSTLQVIGATGGLRPLALFVWRLPPLGRVPQSVCHQPSLLREGLSTERALEGLLPGVDSSMRFEVGGAAEALPALGTLKGPLPGVDQLMGHQVGVLLEELTADATAVLPLLVVGGQVQFEVG